MNHAYPLPPPRDRTHCCQPSHASPPAHKPAPAHSDYRHALNLPHSRRRAPQAPSVHAKVLLQLRVAGRTGGLQHVVKVAVLDRHATGARLRAGALRGGVPLLNRFEVRAQHGRVRLGGSLPLCLRRRGRGWGRVVDALGLGRSRGGVLKDALRSNAEVAERRPRAGELLLQLLLATRQPAAVLMHVCHAFPTLRKRGF